MPSKYLIRNFQRFETYHIFNRGVDKQPIFLDDEDYHLFLYYLFIYLTPLEKVIRRYHNIPPRLFQKNLSKDIELLSYCLLPDHFHLLLRQKTDKGISQFMKQLSNAYTQHVNTKYHRSGSLFGGTFKSVHIPKNDTLLALSRYIHLHPVLDRLQSDPAYPWSSYNEYAGDGGTKLCNTSLILDQFPSVYAYKKFTQDQRAQQKHSHLLKPLAFDLP